MATPHPPATVAQQQTHYSKKARILEDFVSVQSHSNHGNHAPAWKEEEEEEEDEGEESRMEEGGEAQEEPLVRNFELLPWRLV